MTLQANKAIVHMQGDSENDLEALFRVINTSSAEMKKEQPNGGQQLPMRMRNLPPSFFKPTSADPEGEQSTAKVPQINPVTGLAISHSRAHSSPASLTVPKSKTPNQMQPLHLRSQSYDANGTNGEVDPLPPGWGVATTSDGQKYFMNHVDQSTTWQDPRKSRSTSNLAAANPRAPEGWEQAITPDGEVYYINHLNQTTSWAHPGISNMNGVRNQPPPPHSYNNIVPGKRHQIQLHRLQMEKEMLQRRQQELLQQEIKIKRGLLTKEDDSSSMLMKLSNEAFFNKEQPQPTLTTSHIRENSSDSGLGLGTGYYHNSDMDVLNGISDESMSNDNFGSKETSQQQQQQQQQQQNNNNLRPGYLPEFFEILPSSSVDIGLMDGTDSCISMETDDLGVGLDGFNSDILNDVEAAIAPSSSKFDNFLNWV